MVWFFPFIIIGGLFWPLLGYLVLFFMLFLLGLSYFKGRFWCANLCPRGSFLDLVLRKVSLRKKIPHLIISHTFKWTVFFLFIIFFIVQIITADKTLYSIGYVFIKMCLLTSIIAIVLGISIHERTWCAFCPMGTLQGKISSLKPKK